MLYYYRYNLLKKLLTLLYRVYRPDCVTYHMYHLIDFDVPWLKSRITCILDLYPQRSGNRFCPVQQKGFLVHPVRFSRRSTYSTSNFSRYLIIISTVTSSWTYFIPCICTFVPTTPTCSTNKSVVITPYCL
jgi:hypothetical protein